MARSILMLGSTLLAATLGTAIATGAATSVRSVAANLTPAPVRLPPPPVSAPRQPAQTNASPAAPPAAAKPLRIPLANSLLVAPRGCDALGPAFDVLIHFHGAYTTTEPQLMNSGVDAVYLIKNLGNGSGPYESAFAAPGALDAELAAIRARINRSCGGPTRDVARVALSGWSAGYGAIYRILARPAEAARVDAVLLADGMHVGFEPGSRRVRGAAMTPFVDFARLAAHGDKLMAITHSAIVPPTYASTTQTARFIVDQLAAPAIDDPLREPRPGMLLDSSFGRGELHVSGYAGNDKHAHCDHLYAISKVLWSRLRERWSSARREPPPKTEGRSAGGQ